MDPLFEQENKKYYELMVEKWADVLDFGDLPPITDPYKRETIAVLLENQFNDSRANMARDPQLSMTKLLEAAPTNSMGASSSTAGAGSVDIYDPVLISMVRRALPYNMGYDVCGVQPMTLPTGLVFALRSRYSSQNGVEALFHEANSTFSASYAGNSASAIAANNQVGYDPTLLITTGDSSYTKGVPMSTAKAEALGTGTGTGFNEMAISIEKIPVTAESRGLKAEYSHELAQDLKAVHGLDAETELANILSTEILQEINRQIIRSIYITAKTGAQLNVANAGYFDLDVDSNGRWMEEKFKGLLFQIERECNAIFRDIRYGKGNFVITSSDVASALNMVGVLKAQDTSGLTVDESMTTFAGTILGRIKVFIDPYFQSSIGNHFCAVGYKGTSPFDAGLFYCPYVPLQLYRTVGQDSFAPRIGFKTRYGLVAHPFATDAADGKVEVGKKNKFFRLFAAKNLM